MPITFGPNILSVELDHVRLPLARKLPAPPAETVGVVRNEVTTISENAPVVLVTVMGAKGDPGGKERY
jgi:hypothetical protein